MKIYNCLLYGKKNLEGIQIYSPKLNVISIFRFPGASVETAFKFALLGQTLLSFLCREEISKDKKWIIVVYLLCLETYC